MNKALKNVLLVILLIAIVSTISYCNEPFDTEIAHTVNIRRTIEGTGYILRNETLVKQSTKGVFEAKVQEGERVSKGSSIGLAISGNFNTTLVEKLEEVTSRIEEIRESDNFADIYASDEARVFSALKDLTKTIRDEVYQENYAAAQSSTEQLSTLLEKKFSEKNKGAAQELLVQLEEEKYELEQQLGGIREEIKATAAGYFYTSLDGLEMKINEKDLSKYTVSKINKIEETLGEYEPDDHYAGKIIDTYNWYLAASLPDEEADKISVGDSVTLSVDEFDFVKATVFAINPDKTGQSAVIIKCNRDVQGIYEKRVVEYEICYEDYSGIYIPAAAVRVLDDVTGVYILNQNKTVSFRSVDIIAREKDYYVANKKYTPPEDVKYAPLKVYDNILVNPEVVR